METIAYCPLPIPCHNYSTFSANPKYKRKTPNTEHRTHIIEVIMNLDQQFQNLINEAPNYGVPAPIMEHGVIPVLKVYAQQLGHQQYYLRQTLDNNLVLSILSNQAQPEVEKKVVYAFPSVADAIEFADSDIERLDIVAQEVSISQILFQMFTLKEVDSVIFLDTPQDYRQSKEIYCNKLQQAIQQNLKMLLDAKKNSSNIV